jgi:predicted MFS family arabinose efflux permease
LALPVDQPPPPRFQLLAPLAHPHFRKYWLGGMIAQFGETFGLVAYPLLALDLTGSPAGLGIVLMLQAIPRALLMPFGGVAVDRFRARTVLVACALLLGLTDLVLSLLVGAAQVQVVHLYLLALFQGTVSAFMLPASFSMVPELLPPAAIRSGNALTFTSLQAARFAGPPLAGFVIAGMGYGPAFGIKALCFGLMALAISRLPDIRTKSDPAPALVQLREGMRAVWRDKVIFWVVTTGALSLMGVLSAILVGIPTLGRITFEAGPRGVGILLGAFGAGALFGSIGAGSLRSLTRLPLLGAVMRLLNGLAFAGAAAAPSLWGTTPFLAAAGVCVGLSYVANLTVIQTRAPAESRGRVIGVSLFLWFGMEAITYAAVGGVGAWLGPRAVLLVCAGLAVTGGLLALSRRAIREAP